MRQWFIIISYNSEGAINVNKMLATREEVREYVMKLINDDMLEDEENWDCGTENTYDLDYEGLGNGMSGFNNFYDYSINYFAYPLEDIKKFD